MQRRVDSLGQNVKNVENLRTRYQRQVYEVLDLPARKLPPDPIVFAPYVVPAGSRRPVCAPTPNIFKACLHCVAAPIQSSE